MKTESKNVICCRHNRYRQKIFLKTGIIFSHTVHTKTLANKNILLFFGISITVYLEVNMKVQTTVVTMKVQPIVVKIFVLYPREESGLLMLSLCKEINALYGGSGCVG
jgi:hypothetical protein